MRNIPFEDISTLNYFDVRHLLAQTNFARRQILLPSFHPEHTLGLSVWERTSVPVYHTLKDLPVVKWLVYLFGPLFHIICTKAAEETP